MPTRPARSASLLLSGLLTAALLFSAPAAAQEETGSLVGQVRDAGRDEPVGLARVALPDLGLETLADERGRFRFEDVPAGTYALTVGFLGFEASVREITVEAGATERLEVWVQPEPISLEDLEVTTLSLSWFPGFAERKAAGKGHFFTAGDIAEAEPDHLTDLLRDAEGVRIGYNRNAAGANRRYPQFNRRGPAYYGRAATGGRIVRRSAYCRPAVFMDGRQIGPGHEYWHFNEIPPGRVLAMEVFYRPQDVPEAIPFADMRFAAGDWGEGGPPPPDGSADAEGDVRSVLAGAGLLEGFERPVPEEFEEAFVERTVYAGLYEERPEVKYCGAIFVWTKFYLYGEE